MAKFRVKVYENVTIHGEVEIEANDEDSAIEKIYDLGPSNIEIDWGDKDNCNDFNVLSAEEI